MFNNSSRQAAFNFNNHLNNLDKLILKTTWHVDYTHTPCKNGRHSNPVW